jgi:predicted esterase
VSISRYGTGRQNHPAEPADTLAVYQDLLKHENVDPHRVYLLGESEGSTKVSQLIDKHPELWRGAILLSPLEFPNIEKAKNGQFPSVFISIGSEDRIELKRKSEFFVQEACKHCVWAEIHYGQAGHVFYNLDELKKRYKFMVEFILNDR